ncbi:transposase family protein [Rhizobium sp. CRRU65]|uniref:transposase family protein n=1 Tax=Rhizobium sp. CRRU65 TaxID=3399566 RepID=UPI003AF69F9E
MQCGRKRAKVTMPCVARQPPALPHFWCSSGIHAGCEQVHSGDRSRYSDLPLQDFFRRLVSSELSIVQILPQADRVVLVARPTVQETCCPCCGSRTGRVHSHFRRRLADLPWLGVSTGAILPNSAVCDASIQAVRARSSRRDCQRRCYQKRVVRRGHVSTILPSALPPAENLARACRKS